MNQTETRATTALASIMALRMLGLFMILPVFSIYAQHLTNATPLLIGIAIGIYGLTQALCQIPFGLLSDRWGRKQVITAGLLLFALGSVVAAMSDSIGGVIIGRALQGTGAIAAATLALAADLTRDTVRTRAMALLGISIGTAFMLSIVLGPVLNSFIGVAGIFWMTAVLAIIGIAVLHGLVPAPPQQQIHRDAGSIPAQFRRVLGDPQLLRLDASIMLLHWLLTMLFVIMPLILQAHLATDRHWQVYLPVMIIAVLLMVPLIILAEKHKQIKKVFVLAVTALGISQLGLIYLQTQFAGIVLMLILFFTMFNLLEATLPSLISKTAPAESKGTAMGVYASSQFFGAFLGGVSGGWLHQHFGFSAVFIVAAMLAGLWLLIAITLENPRYLSQHLLNVGPVDKQSAGQLTEQLTRIRGVAEAVIVVEEGIAYLKIDRETLDQAALDQFSVAK